MPEEFLPSGVPEGIGQNISQIQGLLDQVSDQAINSPFLQSPTTQNIFSVFKAKFVLYLQVLGIPIWAVLMILLAVAAHTKQNKIMALTGGSLYFFSPLCLVLGTGAFVLQQSTLAGAMNAIHFGSFGIMQITQFLLAVGFLGTLPFYMAIGVAGALFLSALGVI